MPDPSYIRDFDDLARAMVELLSAFQQKHPQHTGDMKCRTIKNEFDNSLTMELAIQVKATEPEPDPPNHGGPSARFTDEDFDEQ